MSSFQIGDMVKFVNEIGGGVVVRIANGLIYVQDETGFDIPMRENELIRLSDMSGAGRMFNGEEMQGLPTAEELRRKAEEESREPARREQQIRNLKEKFTGSADDDDIDKLRDENRRLRSQVDSLTDRVNQLQAQLSRLQQLNVQKVSNNILSQYLVAPGEAEVDLHIEKLHDRPSQLPDAEKHNIQLRFFRTCLNHAILNNMKKVIFIHGVGRGVLKSEIQRELDQYDNLSYMDAPFSKYGAGAIEVYFKTK